MKLLDPLNAITSLRFYGKVARRRPAGSFLYLLFLCAVFSAAGTVAMGGFVRSVMEWFASSVPAMTFSDGRLSSSMTAPVTLRNPDAPKLAVTIDTRRAAAVTTDDLEKSGSVAYVTQSAVYMMKVGGGVAVYDLSKERPNKPVSIDADFFRRAEPAVEGFMRPVAAVFLFFLCLAWKIPASLVYSMLASAFNSSLRAPVDRSGFFSMAVYSQTLGIAVQALLFALRGAILVPPLASMTVTSVYLWLALKTIAALEAGRPPETAPPPPDV